MLTHDSESFVNDAAMKRGISAARAGLRTVAAAQFERAAEILPDDHNVWLWLAWTANSPDNAIRCLERVLELSPGHAAATSGLAWASALVHNTPVAQVTVPDNLSVATSLPTIEIDARLDAAGPESSIVAIESPCPSTEMEHATEKSIESTHDAACDQQPESTTNCSVLDAVDASPQVAPDEPAERPLDPPPVELPLRRWSDLVHRTPESHADAAWPGHVPPPLPSHMPPPLPTEAATAQADPSPFARLRLSATAAATANEMELVPETSADVEALTKSFHPPAGLAAADGRPLVMVVDDSPTVRKLVSLTLERRGYRVISAFDGVAAIKELGACRPDLILLDINMPRLDGYRLCKLIKKHEATQAIPVVMLSGKDGLFDKLRGRLVGCSDYITKPFEADALTHKVAKYLTPASSSL